MPSILIALIALVLALAIQSSVLRRRLKDIRAREQAFHFHDMRDRVQELAIMGRVRPDSITYEFLIWLTNLAIRNAGDMQLRDLIWVAKGIDEEAKRAGDQLWRDLLNQPGELQELFARVLISFADMLASNDPLVSVMFRIEAWGRFRIGKRLRSQVAQIVRGIAPTRVEALQQARRFTELGSEVRAGTHTSPKAA